jgi:hypothetical protein
MPSDAEATTPEEMEKFRHADAILVGDRAIINKALANRELFEKAGFTVTERYEWSILDEEFNIVEPTQAKQAETGSSDRKGLGALFG